MQRPIHHKITLHPLYKDLAPLMDVKFDELENLGQYFALKINFLNYGLVRRDVLRQTVYVHNLQDIPYTVTTSNGQLEEKNLNQYLSELLAKKGLVLDEHNPLFEQLLETTFEKMSANKGIRNALKTGFNQSVLHVLGIMDIQKMLVRANHFEITSIHITRSSNIPITDHNITFEINAQLVKVFGTAQPLNVPEDGLPLLNVTTKYELIADGEAAYPNIELLEYKICIRNGQLNAMLKGIDEAVKHLQSALQEKMDMKKAEEQRNKGLSRPAPKLLPFIVLTRSAHFPEMVKPLQAMIAQTFNELLTTHEISMQTKPTTQPGLFVALDKLSLGTPIEQDFRRDIEEFSKAEVVFIEDVRNAYEELLLEYLRKDNLNLGNLFEDQRKDHSFMIKTKFSNLLDVCNACAKGLFGDAVAEIREQIEKSHAPSQATTRGPGS